MASCGGKHSLYNAFQALFEDGRRGHRAGAVLGELPRHAASRGRHATDRRDHAESGFRMSAGSSRRRSGRARSAVILNSPSNPTGAVYSRTSCARSAQVALRRGLIVITDDIYEHIAERPIEHIGALVPELRPQLVVRQLGVEDLRHDRLADRLHGGPGGADQGDDGAAEPEHVEPDVDRAGRGRRGAARARRNACGDMAREFLARRDLVVARLREIPGVRTRRAGRRVLRLPGRQRVLRAPRTGRRRSRPPTTWGRICCGTPAWRPFPARASARRSTSGCRTPRARRARGGADADS